MLTIGQMNIGGATDRPVLTEVWKTVRTSLEGESGDADGKLATTGVLHLLKQLAWGQ